jgi:pyridinium-3,5-biscarboxylic acid mononucleotide sulfurtransferase
VRSPLQEVGLTKAEIRELAREAGLPNWDKPAAACLSSRIPYNTPVTVEALSQVERAEAFLHEHGFRQVRVRHHGNLARIEVEPHDMLRALEMRDEIVAALKAAGYAFISLDLAGFRSGSLNVDIKKVQVDAR